MEPNKSANYHEDSKLSMASPIHEEVDESEIVRVPRRRANSPAQKTIKISDERTVAEKFAGQKSMTNTPVEYLAETNQSTQHLCFGTLIGVLLALAFGFYCIYPSMSIRHKHVSDDQAQSVILQRFEAAGAR